MKHFINQRVLVTIGENDAPRMTCVDAVSPNGKYIKLDGDGMADECLGWVVLDTVKFVDLIGPASETASVYMRRLQDKPI